MRNDRASSDFGYVQRVNRAIDFIMRHLGQPLILADVAAAAHLSRFHFHRVFKALLGETVAQFVKRQRLERALYLMAHASARSLTDIALRCGFTSSSDFSRSFKQRYGLSPRAFAVETFRTARRAELERILADQQTMPHLEQLPAGANPHGFEVMLSDLPARTVAYMRVFDPYRHGVAAEAYRRLRSWADQRQLSDGQWLGYLWDEPETVAPAQCRYDVALVVDDVRAQGEIGRMDFPAMRVAEVVVRGDVSLEAHALDWLYQTWLPGSGYVPDDQPTFEAWISEPFADGDGDGTFELACQLPVRPV